jgi:hypothetical protein
MYRIVVGKGSGDEWTYNHYRSLLMALQDVLRIQYRYPIPKEHDDNCLSIFDADRGVTVWRE